MLIKAPSRAMPMAVPPWRVALITADTTPERSRGANDIAAALPVGIDSALPRPPTANSRPIVT
jgi:hypothetical protein